jgi:hypothetical protein
MVQRGNRAGFPFKVLSEAFGQLFDGYEAIETGITRAINVSHAARAEQ